MTEYKRLELAAKVPRLFVQTYGSIKNEAGEFDLPRFCPALAGAAFNTHFIEQAEVIRTIQSAQVGLALSACEGAMLAFAEYLLCGLPVVSTAAQGGREEFFDSRFVAITAPSAAAVADAVASQIAGKIDPEMIRQATLARINAHRIRLCEYVNQIIENKGVEAPGVEAVYQHLYDSPEGIYQHYVHRHSLAEVGIANSNSGGESTNTKSV